MPFTIDVRVEKVREKEAAIHGAGHLAQFREDSDGWIYQMLKTGKVCNLCSVVRGGDISAEQNCEPGGPAEILGGLLLMHRRDGLHTPSLIRNAPSQILLSFEMTVAVGPPSSLEPSHE